MNSQCETCAWLVYDEEYEEYICDCQMDEDDFYRTFGRNSETCPNYRNGDEYLVVRKQI